MNKQQTKKTYTIGTRGSLLALTQCGQVKDQLEALSGHHFKLKIIKTEGDLKTEKPLWQMDGKDFFTKELDHALLAKEVDLVVHSYKDLGSERPEGIKLAAVTQRFFTQDILLIKKETIKKISSMKKFIVGTSSPRRIANIEKNLSSFLPHANNIDIKTTMLRGNVNTRIEKLRDGPYDAIVLAMAGIERLALTKSSKETLEQLLDGLNFMILPSSIFPSAASQGALGIECHKDRDDNGELLSYLKKIEHPLSKEEIEEERKDFKKYGGGCHLAVGIQVEKINGAFFRIHRGIYEEKEISHVHYEAQRVTFPGGNVFLGLPHKDHHTTRDPSVLPILKDKLIIKTPFIAELPKDKQHLYLASRYGIKSLDPQELQNRGHLLWSAGQSSMQTIAKAGFWPNGSSEGLGEERVLRFINSKTVGILAHQSSQDITVLSHKDAPSSLGKVIHCYDREIKPLDSGYEKELQACEVFYWTSYHQYQTFTQSMPWIKERLHCAGPGKTYQHFIKQQIPVTLFASMEDFNNWWSQN